jgi:hypothetical protein
MLKHSFLYALVSLLLAASANAQHSIFSIDDFVDPRQHGKPVFISRVALGAALNFVDDDRPLGQDAAFLQLTNSLYWKSWQFDYKHSEVRGKDDPPDPVRCGCSPPTYFPTPPPPNATPEPPRPGARDTLQVGWYRQVPGGAAEPPTVLRYRLTVSWQDIDTVIRSFASGEVVERRSGRETSIGFDADTHLRLGRHDIWGSLLYAKTERTRSLDNRRQQKLAYMVRPPGRPVGPALVRTTLAMGRISGRGGTALNLVNPAVEAFWHHRRTHANVHLVWSGLAANSGAGGWEINHQIAFFVDHALFVKLW